MDRVKKAHNNNTTFYTHFYFFVLVLPENVVLTAWEDAKMGLPDQIHHLSSALHNEVDFFFDITLPQ